MSRSIYIDLLMGNSLQICSFICRGFEYKSGYPLKMDDTGPNYAFQ